GGRRHRSPSVSQRGHSRTVSSAKSLGAGHCSCRASMVPYLHKGCGTIIKYDLKLYYYAADLSPSMHRNPGRAGMVARLEPYQWSGYRSYIGHGTTPEWLKTDCILDYFGRKAPDAKNSYRRFVEDLLKSEY